MKKRILLAVLACVAAASMLVFGACSAKDGGDGKATLKVGFDPGQPPMGYTDDSGNYVGFDIDLAKEVAKRLNMEIKLQPINWDAKDMELDSGNIDLIWNGFTIEGREDAYTWTQPYMKNAQVFVVKEDSTIKTKADLAGKKLALQKESSASKALDKETAFKATLGQVTLTDTNLNALLEVQTGAADAALLDVTMAEYNITKQGGKYKVLDEALAEENYGVGFKKGNTQLRDTVQGVLEEMAKDGTLARISTEWFGQDVTVIGK